MHDLVVGLTDAKPAPAGSPAEGQLDPAGDTNPRCGWGASTLDYVHYHDTEWGRSVVDERTLFEKLCLEGFQSGLSWLTVLRKRESFRQAFADFEATEVATFGPDDVERLLQDASIIRHRGKIELGHQQRPGPGPGVGRGRDPGRHPLVAPTRRAPLPPDDG